VVDEAFAVFMRKPFTYTREDMAEVFSHGGISPQRQIISLMIREGARVAEPGEFTKRAFLNGRIDLAQAESFSTSSRASRMKKREALYSI